MGQATFFDEIHREYSTFDMMSAFDTLESFLASTGPEKYASEFLRLKRITKDAYAYFRDSGLSARSSLSASMKSDIEVGQRLDKSRRRILHYFGNLLMVY